MRKKAVRSSWILGLTAVLLSAAVASQQETRSEQQAAPPNSTAPIPLKSPAIIPGQASPTPRANPSTQQQTAPPSTTAPIPLQSQPIPGQAAPTPVTPTTQTPAEPAPATQTTAAPAQTTQTPATQTTPAAPTAPVTTTPAQTQPQPQAPGGMSFEFPNGSLTEFIDIIAQRLKINYILDPAVGAKGSVSLFTYGEPKPTDLMTLLHTVLRVNGATIVQVGDLYRIIPINRISSLPVPPTMNMDQNKLPDDERMILDMIFLKYTTAGEMDKLLSPFYGEGASHGIYEPANLLILQDNARNMKRTLQLIDMFDSDTFAGQRVHLFDIQNSRPSDMVKELDTVFKAYALSDKSSSVKFIPIDRINVIIAAAPNPGIFAQVQTWLDKLDVAVKVQAGEVSTYVYRLKYQRAETTALAITALYTGNVGALMGMAMMMGGGGYGMGMGGMGMGGMGMGGMGMGGYGGMNYGGGGGYGMGMGGYGMGGMGMGGYGMGMGMNPYASNSSMSAGSGSGGIPPINVPPAGSGLAVPTTGPGTDQSGAYLGLANAQGGPGARVPHIIPNPFDNTLLIQASPQEWTQIQNLLHQLDIAPRQVLIEAKIYELDLNGAFSEGVTAYLEKAGTNGTGLGRALSAVTSSAGLNLSVGALVGHSKEILSVLQAAEHRDQSRVISAPSIIATDSIPAVMNVGEDVPVLTSQAVVGGVQSNGTNVFSNTVSNQSSGVTLNILARVNSSGVVTMVIDQDVSSPQAPSTGGIQSPSFSRRSFQTQLTVQDGDTVAIGGFIQEQSGKASDGVPILQRIPILGGLFGARSYNRGRTELIIFLTPKVLYDSNQVIEATDEIRSSLKQLNKAIKDQ